MFIKAFEYRLPPIPCLWIKDDTRNIKVTLFTSENHMILRHGMDWKLIRLYMNMPKKQNLLCYHGFQNISSDDLDGVTEPDGSGRPVRVMSTCLQRCTALNFHANRDACGNRGHTSKADEALSWACADAISPSCCDHSTRAIS